MGTSHPCLSEFFWFSQITPRTPCEMTLLLQSLGSGPGNCGVLNVYSPRLAREAVRLVFRAVVLVAARAALMFLPRTVVVMVVPDRPRSPRRKPAGLSASRPRSARHHDSSLLHNVDSCSAGSCLSTPPLRPARLGKPCWCCHPHTGLCGKVRRQHRLSLIAISGF